jgi:hypothetical protein
MESPGLEHTSGATFAPTSDVQKAHESIRLSKPRALQARKQPHIESQTTISQDQE